MADSEGEDPDWQDTLIRVYLFVCRHWAGRLPVVVQRQSNNSDPDFTDEEVLTIYLFGLIRNRETMGSIHEYAEDHFPEWFPDLPCYGGYIQRLNRLNAVFATLTEGTGKEKRSSQAKVAPQIADKGYCSSKDTFYHSVKLHVVAQK